MQLFYVYVYFDPRFTGKYIIDGREVNLKPVYIGKGKSSRVLKHINTKRKTKLGNLNRHLISNGILPSYEILKEFENEEDAHTYEVKLIREIGREDLGRGPLYNLTDGGEGVSGRLWSDEEKHIVSVRSKDYWNNISEDGKKLHGIISKSNKTNQGKLEGIIKYKQTRNNWTDDYKAEIERRRMLTWKKNYCNTKEKKDQRKEKCMQASLKRQMYFLTYKNNNGDIKQGFLKDLIACGWGKDAIEWRIKGKIPTNKPYRVRHTGDVIVITEVVKKRYSSS